MKKITIAAGSFWPEIGGPVSYLKSILPELKEAGFDIDVVARSKKSKYPEDSGFDFKVYRIKDWSLKPFNYLRYFLKLLKVAKSSDIIYAQGPVSSGFPAYLVNKFLKKKFVVKITGDYAWESRFLKANRAPTSAKASGQYSFEDEIIDVLEFQRQKISGKSGALRKIQMKICQAADKVIVPSKFLAKVVGHWGVKKEK